MVFSASRAMRNVVVKEKDVIMPFVVLLTISGSLLVAWSIVDPLVWVRTEPNELNESQGYCQSLGSSYIIFLALIVVVNFLALVLASVQAFRARDINADFSESFYIGMTIISLLQALVLGVPIMILVRHFYLAFFFLKQPQITLDKLT